jgi:hypothetical protein
VNYTLKTRSGKGTHRDSVYGEIRDQDGELCVSATLEYCLNWLAERHQEYNTNQGLREAQRLYESV